MPSTKASYANSIGAIILGTRQLNTIPTCQRATGGHESQIIAAVMHLVDSMPTKRHEQFWRSCLGCPVQGVAMLPKK